MLKLVARMLKLVTELSSIFMRSNYFDNPTKLCPHLLRFSYASVIAPSPFWLVSLLLL